MRPRRQGHPTKRGRAGVGCCRSWEAKSQMSVQTTVAMLKRTCLSLFLLAAVACGDSSTASPSPTSTVPSPLQPANGAQISFGQPVTLVVEGTLSDGSIFEVARDPAFTQTVLTFTYARRWCGSVGLTCVLQGANGQQTSLLIGTYDEDDLTDGDYYWHANARPTGVFSPTFKFTDGPASARSTR